MGGSQAPLEELCSWGSQCGPHLSQSLIDPQAVASQKRQISRTGWVDAEIKVNQKWTAPLTARTKGPQIPRCTSGKATLEQWKWNLSQSPARV